MIEKNDCVKIEYNAYLKEGKQLFDTTSEKKAKSAGIYQQQASYEPVNVIIGKRFIIPGVDDSLVGKKVGESYEIEVGHEQAFGKKNGKLIQLIPTSVFKKNNINPVMGMQVFVDNTPGIVRSASPGRTLVDFNHPLSGKDLIYEVKILEKIIDDVSIVSAVTDFLLGKGNASINKEGNEIQIKTKMEVPKQIKDIINKNAKETLKKECNLKFILQ